MNWQLYFFILGMIVFVAALIFAILYSVAKQDNPNLPSPLTKGFWM
jgi:hypothetical protein